MILGHIAKTDDTDFLGTTTEGSADLDKWRAFVGDAKSLLGHRWGLRSK